MTNNAQQLSADGRWWESWPYKKIATIGENADEVPIYDIPAIAAEVRREERVKVLEEVEKMICKMVMDEKNCNCYTCKSDYGTCASFQWNHAHNEVLNRLTSLRKEKKPEPMKCDVCGKTTPDVSYRPNAYANDVGNDPEAMHTVCDECDYQNRMDI